MATQSSVARIREHVLKSARHIEELARSDVEPDVFQREFLQALMSALGSRAGAVWMRGPGNQLAPTAEVNLRDSDVLAGLEADRANSRLLSDVISTGEASTVSPEDDGEAELPTEHLTLLGPLFAGKDCIGVVELFQRPDGSPGARPGYLQFVEQMCGLASRFLTNRAQGAETTAPEEFWKTFEQLALRLQHSLDSKELASVAASDGRLLLGCDRLSVAVQRGRKATIRAISGQDSVNQRANLVRAMSAVVRKVIAMREPILYSGQVDDLPPQIEIPLANYVQESGSRLVLVIPLFEHDPLVPRGEGKDDRPKAPKRAKPVGCLVVEQISESTPRPLLQERAAILADHVAAALCNARQHQRIFLLGFWRFLGRCLEWFHGRKLAKTIAVLAIIGGITAALVLYPYEYRVEGEGRLMPVVQREVFAPWDGDVETIYVGGGQRVTKDQELLKLRNDDLHAKLLATRNELTEKQKLILALFAEIDDAVTAADRQEETRLQGKLAETKIEIAGLTEQIELLEEREQQLTVRAPIDGVVTDFQLEQLLMDRPVRRGEVLMEVMDDKGQWRLELEVEEHRMGHVLQAQQKQQRDDLDVEFVLATSTESTYTGRLQTIASRSTASQEKGSVLEVFAGLDEDQLADRRIGAEVRAKISCGKRSLGYVLFGDVIEFVRKWLWL